MERRGLERELADRGEQEQGVSAKAVVGDGQHAHSNVDLCLVHTRAQGVLPHALALPLGLCATRIT